MNGVRLFESPRLPVILQAEQSECGLACLAMVLNFHGHRIDINTLRALEDALESFAGTLLVISHDRWFLDRIATHILAFEGNSEVVWFPGNYSEYAEDRRRRLGPIADRPHRITYRKLRRA